MKLNIPIIKVTIFCVCFLLLYDDQLWAQAKNWTVKSNEEVTEALSPGVRYRFPQFVPGEVHYRDATTSKGLLDYNLLIEEMQFLNAGGDTLSLDNESTIKYITINSDTFYFFGKYLELVMGNQLVKLAKRQRLKQGDVRKIGGYDQATSTSAITNITSIYNGNQFTKLNARTEVLLEKEINYYIGNQYNNFVLANRKNLLRLFEKQKKLIVSFLEENNTRFYNEDDLKALTNFLLKTVQ